MFSVDLQIGCNMGLLGLFHILWFKLPCLRRLLNQASLSQRRAASTVGEMSQSSNLYHLVFFFGFFSETFISTADRR